MRSIGGESVPKVPTTPPFHGVLKGIGRVVKWTLIVSAMTLLVAVPTASAGPAFDETDVATGEGGGAMTLGPITYWTCQIHRSAPEDADVIAAVGENSCNAAIQRMTGRVRLERPLGTVLTRGNLFDCSSCAYRASISDLGPVVHGGTYHYFFNTTLTLTYGAWWSAWPSACTANRETLSCSFHRSFVAS
jgi:hypothetical protein